MKKVLTLIFLFMFVATNVNAQSLRLTNTEPNVVAGGTGTDYTSDANCMGAWYMNNNGGNETDRSGENETLTQSGGTIPTDADVKAGYSGTSRLFASADTEQLEAADGGSTDISGANQTLSLACWVKLNTLQFSGLIVKHSNGDNRRQYEFVVLATGAVRFKISSNGVLSSESTSNAATIGTGTWFHVAGVYDDTDIRIYINGVLDSNGADNPKAYTDGIADKTAKFMIGARDEPAGIDAFTDGYIDEVIVLDRDLSASEIAELFNTGISGNKGGND